MYGASVSTSSSSVSSETPSHSVSSLDHEVTQWMSQWTGSAGRARNSSHVQRRVSSISPSRVKLQASVGVWGVGPADSTGKPATRCWPGGRRPSSPPGSRRRKPRVIEGMGLLSHVPAPRYRGVGRRACHPFCVKRALVIVLGAGALFAACGSGNGDAAGSPAANSPPTAGTAARGVALKRIGRFESPVYVPSPRGDARHLFVVEQEGRVRVLVDGHARATPFLDIRSQVTSGGEQGLLSIAFPPDYARSGRFYVYFTDRSGDQRIVEYHRRTAEQADAGSGRLVLHMPDREANHNGGLLLFGPDGHMYVGTGDGGGAGDQHGSHGNAQSLGSLLG